MKENQSISYFSILLRLKEYITSLQKLINNLYGQLATKDKVIAEKDKALEEALAELRRLKKLPKKPNLKPSKLDERPADDKKEASKQKRAGSAKKSKKSNLKIHEYKEIKAKEIPQDWLLIGHRSYVIQDFIVRANNISYEREVWQSPDGKSEIVATLPVHLQNKHFGADLEAYILYQYNECCVSEPLILSSLKDFGVDISSGHINAVLTQNKDQFHEEKKTLLEKAIALKEELRTDDTGARHRFKNGYCNCINSDLFTYFTTSYSKSRINFLEILGLERAIYELNETALEYVQAEGLSPKYYSVLYASYQNGQTTFNSKKALAAYFKQHNFTAKYAIRTMTEAFLVGALVAHGFDPTTLIHADGAGQFNVFARCLCWKHAERPLVQLKCYNPIQQTLLEDKKHAYWSLYQELKDYKQKPTSQKAVLLEQQFDLLCEPVLNYDSLNQVLKELKAKKNWLLLVLERPEASLHNNTSERDIREYAKRRKISAGTRSEKGRKARDTFLSLKKTCRKLNISFWEYLRDRLQNKKQIPPLSQMMELKAITAKA